MLLGIPWVQSLATQRPPALMLQGTGISSSAPQPQHMLGSVRRARCGGIQSFVKELCELPGSPSHTLCLLPGMPFPRIWGFPGEAASGHAPAAPSPKPDGSSVAAHGFGLGPSPSLMLGHRSGHGVQGRRGVSRVKGAGWGQAPWSHISQSRVPPALAPPRDAVTSQQRPFPPTGSGNHQIRAKSQLGRALGRELG